MRDYTEIKLNSRLQKIGGLPDRYFDPDSRWNKRAYSSVETDSSIELAGKSVQASTTGFSENIVGFVMGNVVISSFASGSILTFHTDARFKSPNKGKRFFGNPHVAWYLGSYSDPYTTPLAAWQIYPKTGGSVTYGRFATDCFYDAHVWGGVNGKLVGQICDTTGTSSQNVTLRLDWNYLNYLSETR